ncbi:MAG: hypothetical protein HKM24_07190 [Gammaproteobacteria bacterium]|nr:hypothetical protein [Gammaproteobacteria bacterium]
MTEAKQFSETVVMDRPMDVAKDHAKTREQILQRNAHGTTTADAANPDIVTAPVAYLT